MSLRPGSFPQPDVLTREARSISAPQLGQDMSVAWTGAPHQAHRLERGAAPAGGTDGEGGWGSWPAIRALSLLRGGVVDVHGPDAPAAGTGHLRQVHASAAEEAAGQLLGLDLHRHRGVLVE